MIRKIALAVAALVLVVLAYAATRPDSFRVERSASVQAPPEAVYALIDDFHRWEAWSPYERLDPAMEKTFSGAASGRGAVYAWEGRKSGAGRMEITEASSASRVLIRLDFTRPFRASNTAEFTLEPRGDTTRVTWAMYGPSPYVSKVMGVFFDMDRMIGRDFEAGLADLKAAAERVENEAARSTQG